VTGSRKRINSHTAPNRPSATSSGVAWPLPEARQPCPHLLYTSVQTCRTDPYLPYYLRTDLPYRPVHLPYNPPYTDRTTTDTDRTTTDTDRHRPTTDGRTPSVHRLYTLRTVLNNVKY